MGSGSESDSGSGGNDDENVQPSTEIELEYDVCYTVNSDDFYFIHGKNDVAILLRNDYFGGATTFTYDSVNKIVSLQSGGELELNSVNSYTKNTSKTFTGAELTTDVFQGVYENADGSKYLIVAMYSHDNNDFIALFTSDGESGAWSNTYFAMNTGSAASTASLVDAGEIQYNGVTYTLDLD